MFGAEPWTEAMRGQLESELGLKALNIYGLSEIIGPGVAAECPEARDGLHVQEDHFLVEVVDPKTGGAVARRDVWRARLHDADQGSDATAALPDRRHRQPDPRALRLRPHVRAHERHPRSPRRHADRPRGQPLPEPDRARAARATRDRPALPARRRTSRPARRGHDPLRARRGRCRPGELAARVRSAVRAGIGIGVTVSVLAPGEVPRSEGKAVRVIDRRNLK